jgi:thiol-disulfide isomerase/thioredoxin
MKKAFFVFVIVSVGLLVAGAILFSKPKGSTIQPNGDYEFFWGIGCPHCAQVEEFLDNWGSENNLKISKYEIYNNPENANLFNQRARECGLLSNQMGVPLLYTPDNQCIVGDSPIINYLESLEI